MHISIFLYVYAYNFFSVSNQEVEGTLIGYIYIYIHTKKKVKHPMFFFKWQMIRQISRDYWPDNLNNAIISDV
jgi:hypothetical protein